jgi:DNA-binding LacI/PurR family transcriptional regulator
MGDPKHKQIFNDLKTDILSGRYRPGQKLPSEAALMKRTGVSRITVSRALRDLQTAGLVQRVAGSGTFVYGKSLKGSRNYLFGLLIPELGQTEIFAPICRAIASSPAAQSHALLWGNPGSGSPAQQAMALLQQFLNRGVDGVFFAPLEFGANAEPVNRKIISRLRKEKIATVLLDRRISRLTSRDRTDLTGIHHRHAAFVATEHLIRSGCKHICFVTSEQRSSSVEDRAAGFLQALAQYGLKPQEGQLSIRAHMGRPREWTSKSFPFGAVCVNDHVAGQLLTLASTWQLDIPANLRITGVDDLSYASMLPVPLTTIRQPIAQIGDTALSLMLERIALPNRPPREVLLDGELVVRRSTQPI